MINHIYGREPTDAEIEEARINGYKYRKLIIGETIIGYELKQLPTQCCKSSTPIKK